MRTQQDAFWREVSTAITPGGGRALVTDNVHEFEIILAHDGQTITSTEAVFHRQPWTTCTGAGAALRQLIGTPIGPAGHGSIGRGIDAGHQCTHLFDLARFAIAQIARGHDRHYRIDVVSSGAGAAGTARIARDNAEIFAWTYEDHHIVAPEPLAGHALQGRSTWPAWLQEDADALEAALMLRRAVTVVRGRLTGGIYVSRADELPWLMGSCFTFQPGRATEARRPAGFRDNPPF